MPYSKFPKWWIMNGVSTMATTPVTTRPSQLEKMLRRIKRVLADLEAMQSSHSSGRLQSRHRSRRRLGGRFHGRLRYNRLLGGAEGGRHRDRTHSRLQGKT